MGFVLKEAFGIGSANHGAGPGSYIYIHIERGCPMDKNRLQPFGLGKFMLWESILSPTPNRCIAAGNADHEPHVGVGREQSEGNPKVRPQNSPAPSACSSTKSQTRRRNPKDPRTFLEMCFFPHQNREDISVGSSHKPKTWQVFHTWHAQTHPSPLTRPGSKASTFATPGCA